MNEGVHRKREYRVRDVMLPTDGLILQYCVCLCEDRVVASPLRPVSGVPPWLTAVKPLRPGHIMVDFGNDRDGQSVAAGRMPRSVETHLHPV